MLASRTSTLSGLVAALLILGPTLANAGVRPNTDRSAWNVSVLRNLDRYDSHWGASAGGCWRGRVDLRLEMRGDGVMGRDAHFLRCEAALIKRRGFMFEAGYWYHLSSASRFDADVLLTRFSWPLRLANRMLIVPRAILMRQAGDWGDSLDPGQVIAFAGLDLLLADSWTFCTEMSLNQDFRYHDLEFRLEYWW